MGLPACTSRTSPSKRLRVSPMDSHLKKSSSIFALAEWKLDRGTSPPPQVAASNPSAAAAMAVRNGLSQCRAGCAMSHGGEHWGILA